ncbi:hypothetical protein LUZ60_014643 [Juncus effusus]|nr:hypothetical protein LUZ60_014643 [Juncus effusus]
MESSSCVPPGFRFHPTDEELVGYYLRKKIESLKIDLDVIRDIDLYRIEPWDLKDHCRIGYEEQSEWYFFSYKDRKYPTGTRTNRATMAGFWKATGRDKAVRDKNKLIGMRKTLVFYKGRAPNGQKSDWIMHEYRLESDENAPPQEEGWVVCRAFKKRPACPTRNPNLDAWNSAYSYRDQNTTNSTNHPHAVSCKRDQSQIDNLNNILHYNSRNPSFMHLLPDLESPSLSKRPCLLSISEQNGEKVTDWRALDKFVASQLSPDQDGLVQTQEVLEGFGVLDQDLKGFLSNSECDVGACFFDD